MTELFGSSGHGARGYIRRPLQSAAAEYTSLPRDTLKGHIMGRILFYALLLVAGVSASKKITKSPVFSWDTDPVCPVGETPFDCHLKKTQCGPISKVLEPNGAYIKNFIVCAKSAAAELGPFFFKNVGADYSGDVGTDKLTMKEVRQCALNNTGLLMPDLTLNRTAIAVSVNAAFKNSPLGAVVAKAASTCPEPSNFMMVDYMNCLKTTCLDNAVALSVSTTKQTPVANNALPATEAPRKSDDRQSRDTPPATDAPLATETPRKSDDRQSRDTPPVTDAPRESDNSQSRDTLPATDAPRESDDRQSRDTPPATDAPRESDDRRGRDNRHDAEAPHETEEASHATEAPRATEPPHKIPIRVLADF